MNNHSTFLNKPIRITDQQWSKETIPLVSISCITYNHEDYIRDAIDGFLMQKTTFPVEILIHDDASTDKTASIVREYELKYPQLIKPIYQTVNQYSKRDGTIGRLQRGRARGKYYATCEGDDYWTDPLKLQKQVDFMEANPTYSMCVHASKKVNVNGTDVGEIRPYSYSRSSTPKDIILTSGNFFATSSYMVKKEIFNDNEPEFISLSPVGDYALNLLCISIGGIYYIDEFMSNYRIGVPGSYITLLNRKSYREKAEKVKQRIKMLHSYNKFTKYKYNGHVLKKIESLNFDLLVLSQRLKATIKHSHFSKLPLIEKMKIIIKSLLPLNIIQLISKIKNSLS